MSRTRRTFGKDFKAKVVLEALKEKDTIEVLAKKYELLPNQISMWKSEAIRNFLQFFLQKNGRYKDEIPTEKLYSNRSADLRMTLKKSGLVSISERVKMVDTQNKLSIVKQCRLLKIHRGGLIIKQNRKV
jgi:transposase-like protein